MSFKTAAVRILSLLAFGLCMVVPAQAYDIDVHFYQTYSMARYAGLKHEAAALIAAAAQWPDETRVIASPFIDPKMRRLFHFPCDTQGRSAEGNTMGKKTDKDDVIGKAKATHVQMCEVTPDNDMAYLLMYEGLCHDCDRTTNQLIFSDAQKGDLLKAATSLHTIEDSFAHAGTPSESGHAPSGHWPDRPYNLNGSIPKFYLMIDSAMKGIVALRDTLMKQRPNLCDEATRDPRPMAGVRPEMENCKRSAEQLATGYKSLPILHKTIEPYILKDKLYVKQVVRWALQKMKDIEHSDETGRVVRWLNPNFDVLTWLDRQKDIIEMMESGKHDVYDVMYVLFPRLYYLEPKDAADLWLDKKSPMRNFVAIRFALLGMKLRLTIPDSVYPDLVAKDKLINDADIEIRRLRKLQTPPSTGRGTTLSGQRDTNAAARAAALSIEREANLALREDIRQKIADESAARKCGDPSYKCDALHRSARLMKELVDDALRVDVPRPITGAYHENEYEEDGAFPRRLELQMRTVAVREMIQTLYGTNVRFISNKPEWSSPAYQKAHADQSKDFAGEDDLVKNVVPSHLTGTEAQVTMNFEQIKQWNDAMVRFSYPLLANRFVPKGGPLSDEFIMAFEQLVQVDENLKELKDAVGDLGYSDIFGVAREGLAIKDFMDKYGGWKSVWHLFQEDYLTTHLIPPDDMTVRLKDHIANRSEFYVRDDQLAYLDNAFGAIGNRGPKGQTFFADPTPFVTGLVRDQVRVQIKPGAVRP